MPPGATDPARTANAARNAIVPFGRSRRWRDARRSLWRLLDPHVLPGARVAVVGAGNAYDVPLTRLAQRAASVDLVDIDPDAVARAVRRLRGQSNVQGALEDVTAGAADAIVQAALGRAPTAAPLPGGPLAGSPYDLVVADLFFTQLLYPALRDSGLPGATIDAVLREHGQPLTDAVAGRLHASAPAGTVVYVHDLLGWWDGHPQPFTVDELLRLARRDVDAALALARTGTTPYSGDPRLALAGLGAEVVETAFWRWPFSPGADYAVCATVARSR